MNKEEMILRGIDEIPMFTFNTKTKEFSVLGHKFEGVNSIEDFINYIHNLNKENEQLKSNIEEAIHNIKYKENIIKSFPNSIRGIDFSDLISILERGKE